MADHRISIADLKAAHEAFEVVEPRGVFYRAATELVALTLQGYSSLTVAEALAVLLQTWNKNAYRFKKRTFDARHFDEIEALLRRHEGPLAAYRAQKLEHLDPEIRADVVAMFERFEGVLGPVGAAKTLHLLAPALFPLWDVAIARGRGLPLLRAGANGDRYWQFMLLVRAQCLDLRRQGATGNLPKLIDEYNYCRYTKKVLCLVG
jgi:hypothetical protein